MQLFDDLRHDLIYAMRTLRREPSLVTAVLVTFALAIGANSAMVGLISRLMLSAPPGVEDPARVAHLQVVYAGLDGSRDAMSTTSYPVFRAAASGRAFSSAAAVYATKLEVGRGAGGSPGDCGLGRLLRRPRRAAIARPVLRPGR